jgi:hypothetical protein
MKSHIYGVRCSVGACGHEDEKLADQLLDGVLLGVRFLEFQVEQLAIHEGSQKILF